MATVPAPTTFVATNVLTAAQMNTNVRDAINFLIAPPSFVGVGTLGQSIPNATFTAITLDTELLDSDNAHSTTTNPSRFTAVTPGWYLVTANLEYATNTSGIRYLRIVLNGNPVAGCDTNAASSSLTNLSTSTIVKMSVGDYVYSDAYQNSGSTIALSNGNNGGTRFTVQWVHA